MEHDYRDAAIILTNHQKWRKGCDETLQTNPRQLSSAIKLAIEALRIAQRLQEGGVSKEMHNRGVDEFDLPENVDCIFDAMSQQLLKEVSDG